jgi:hypothetical protein
MSKSVSYIGTHVNDQQFQNGVSYEAFKELLRQFAEEYYNDKSGAALAAKDFVHRVFSIQNVKAEGNVQAIYPNDPLVEQPVISEQMKALANEVAAKYGLAPCDPIGWLYALVDMYNEGANNQKSKP